jgi:hypothetical protein
MTIMENYFIFIFINYNYNFYNYFCRHRIQEQSDNNTKLELTLTKLENYIKVLENKIEIFQAKELHRVNDDLVEVILWNNLLLINFY